MKYPTLKTKNIKLRDFSEIAIDATVTLDSRPVVAVHDYGGHFDDISLSALEAERLGNALLKAAACVRGKAAYVAAHQVAPENAATRSPRAGRGNP